MLKIYKILICFSVLAAFFGFYAFNYGETRLTSKRSPSPVKKERKTVSIERQTKNEDMVTAIIIMPKSYLPALKRFSQSAMARDIKILQAQLEVKDGKMMAIRQDNRVKQRDRKTEPTNNPAHKTAGLSAKHPPDAENQILSSGFLYLLASIQKDRFIR